MTGGGLLALVQYGAQNVILSGNPQMSYFYKVFRRYTHFSMENATVPLEGPNELSFDQPTRLRAKIPRIGDLMSDVYFTFRIPDIYSKYLDPATRTYQYEFKWVKYLGAALIQNAAFFVGGQKIHEFDGRYLFSRALLDYDQDQFEKWRILVGDVDALTTPENSIYAGGRNKVGYPNVLLDPSRQTTAQQNRPSIFGQDIHVPLSFWFTEAFSQALPLVGLQYQDCEVQLTLNPISSLYTYIDISGYRVAPGYKVNAPIADILNNLPQYISYPDISGQIRNFLVDWGYTLPALQGWFLNPRLQCTYIYLPDEERQIFAGTHLSYLMYQVTQYPFLGLYTRQILDLYTHNPITRLIFYTTRSDSVPRNDQFNISNWWTYPNPPFVPTPGQTPVLTNAYSSGILAPQSQLEMLRSIRVLVNGNEIQEQKPTDFFTKIVPYKYTKGISKGLLPVYSFSLHSPDTQPSGSINASRIQNFQVEVDVWPLPQNTTYTYDLTIYVESINFFEVSSGSGGLKYAL
jgi:Major capsid protein N-terminus/Large eukaryotic DNA virus major capsid protein